MKFKASNITWDTDGEEVEFLPAEAEVECHSEEEVADALTDTYGFCIFTLDIEPMK